MSQDSFLILLNMENYPEDEALARSLGNFSPHPLTRYRMDLKSVCRPVPALRPGERLLAVPSRCGLPISSRLGSTGVLSLRLSVGSPMTYRVREEL